VRITCISKSLRVEIRNQNNNLSRRCYTILTRIAIPRRPDGRPRTPACLAEFNHCSTATKEIPTSVRMVRGRWSVLDMDRP
jgi:hypothetical protein